MDESKRVKELENKVRILEDKLAQTQNLATIGELTSTTTHEFNNILTTVINYARMGLRHTDEPTRTKCLDKILTASSRAAKITKTILGAAKNRKNTHEPTDLKTLVEDTLLLLEREMNKYKIDIEKHFADVPEIMAEGNQIQQVLLNLMINARQAMPGGGRLVLKITHNTADPDYKTVDLFVRDYGCGISMDKLPHIFDPFYSTKAGPDESGKGGTGLGLSMCKSVMEAHKGRIRVESAPGKGTAFTLRFPVPEKQSTQNPPIVVNNYNMVYNSEQLT